VTPVAGGCTAKAVVTTPCQYDTQEKTHKTY